MFGESRQSGIPESSFYYVVLAAACFRRTACGCHPNTGGVLRDMGHKYLAKADRGSADQPEFSLARIRRTGTKISWRKQWMVD
jgi:hypothetical protein